MLEYGSTKLEKLMLKPGEILDGKYRITRKIGEGGMGAVYAAENTRVRKIVAVKVLHKGGGGVADAVERFEREAQAAGQIGSDHIVEVYDLGTTSDGERFMVMEYLDGESLRDRFKKGSVVPPSAIVPLVLQLLEGLAAAHAAEIVHRDLKPDNIFILREKAGRPDFVKILDFGISKFLNVTEGGGAVTRTGMVMGSPNYMSPEQVKSSNDVDGRSDLYTVGVILFEAVTGHVPFKAPTFTELLFKIVYEPLPHPCAINPGLDPAFGDILLRACAADRADRFQSAQEFSAALVAYLGTAPAFAAPSVRQMAKLPPPSLPRLPPPQPSTSTAPRSGMGGPPSRPVPLADLTFDEPSSAESAPSLARGPGAPSAPSLARGPGAAPSLARGPGAPSAPSLARGPGAPSAPSLAGGPGAALSLGPGAAPSLAGGPGASAAEPEDDGARTVALDIPSSGFGPPPGGPLQPPGSQSGSFRFGPPPARPAEPLGAHPAGAVASVAPATPISFPNPATGGDIAGSLGPASASGGYANPLFASANPSGGNLNQSGGFANANQSGGFANANQSGGFPNANQSGGFANANQSGGFANGNQSGGFANGNQSGGFANGNQSGGFASANQSGGFPPNTFGATVQPAEPVEPRRSKKLIAVAGTLALLAGAAVGTIFYARSSGSSSGSQTSTAASNEPSKVTAPSSAAVPAPTTSAPPAVSLATPSPSTSAAPSAVSSASSASPASSARPGPVVVPVIPTKPKPDDKLGY